MKRRDFLKLLTVAPIAPSVLAAMPKESVVKVIDDVKINFGNDDYTLEFDSISSTHSTEPAIGRLYWQVFADNPGKMWVYTGKPEGWLEIPDEKESANEGWVEYRPNHKGFIIYDS